MIIEGIPCPINTVWIETIRKTAAQYPGIKMIMDGSEPFVQANVTYPPDQCATYYNRI